MTDDRLTLDYYGYKCWVTKSEYNDYYVGFACNISEGGRCFISFSKQSAPALIDICEQIKQLKENK